MDMGRVRKINLRGWDEDDDKVEEASGYCVVEDGGGEKVYGRQDGVWALTGMAERSAVCLHAEF